MKALLLYPDRDFDLEQAPPHQSQSLLQDLELETLLEAMAGGDEYVLGVARKVLLAGMSSDVEVVSYRQRIAQDCLKNPAVVRQLYDLAVEAIEDKRKHYWGVLANYPSSVLTGSIELLQLFMATLMKLRSVAQAHAAEFDSTGFTTLLAMLQSEFGDDYFASIHEHLSRLKFKDGVVVSASLGSSNEGIDYVLRREHDERPAWLKRLLRQGPPGYTFRIAERDDAGARALSQLRDRGINLVANALAQSMDHILSFFEMLRAELAFYVGCLNLHERLSTLGAPVCFPAPQEPHTSRLRCSGLYDICLALHMQHRVVGNAVDANGKRLLIITGPNQGGKSSFLRSIGLAQLMMQCGLFVAADAFEAELCTGLFTHYKREEDASMTSGKFDEEIARMSAIATDITPNSMLLFNESFASTNEREGSETARQIVRALLERQIKVLFVTHLYEFAHGLYARQMRDALFLRADRHADGTRTYKLMEGEPLGTSHGEDLYQEIFARAEMVTLSAP